MSKGLQKDGIMISTNGTYPSIFVKDTGQLLTMSWW